MQSCDKEGRRPVEVLGKQANMPVLGGRIDRRSSRTAVGVAVEIELAERFLEAFSVSPVLHKHMHR